MNAPVRFEALIWMASPLLAWAQGSAEPPQALPQAKPAPAARSSRARRKRKKAVA